jgi:predicted DNA-binding antitoxin AbrB/MazE fold protein
MAEWCTIEKGYEDVGELAMTIQVEATYENGVLKLDRSLPFKEQERVHVTVERKASVTQPEPADEWERLLRSVATDCGVSLPNSALSREKLYD